MDLDNYWMSIGRVSYYGGGLPMEYGRPLYNFIYLLLSFPSPILSRRRLDMYHTSTHGVASVRLRIQDRSETWCTRLVENTGRKKSPKIRHLRTIAQLCRAISSLVWLITTSDHIEPHRTKWDHIWVYGPTTSHKGAKTHKPHTCEHL